MALTNEQITAQNFKDFYGQIRPYLNGSAHAGFTPIGTVISVMGNHAPANYLVCDGTVYNIEDYIELASYFIQEFGSSNYFGGDGETTFAVPNLKGEFLRGTGTNGHNGQGAGANVGVHQDATLFPNYFGSTSSTGTIDIAKTSVSNRDSSPSGTAKARYSSASDTGSAYDVNFTSRPTNTSVLYCIAYKNIYTDIVSDDEVIITKTNVDPSDYYGREYELFDKDLASLDGSVSFTKTNKVSSVTMAGGTLSGNVYTLVFYLVTAVQISDDAVVLGTLDLSNVATTQLRTQNVPAVSDDGNGMAMVHFQGNSANPGVFEISCVDAYYTKPIASGKTIGFSISIPIPFAARKDEACDKFYWRRVTD